MSTPKIAHYVWIGNAPRPENVIDTWRKCLSKDWEIREWNEDSLRILPTWHSTFVQEALQAKKYGISVDPLRANILYDYGGVWLDTDCILKRDISPFCQYDFFIGYESEPWLNVGLVGSRKNSCITKKVMDYYSGLSDVAISSIKEDPSKFVSVIGTGPHVITRAVCQLTGFLPNGKPQTLEYDNMKIRLEPACTFVLDDEISGAINYAEHLFSASWTDKASEWSKVVRRQYEYWKTRNSINWRK